MQHIYNRESGRHYMHIHLYRYSIQQVAQTTNEVYKRQQTELYKTTDRAL